MTKVDEKGCWKLEKPPAAIYKYKTETKKYLSFKTKKVTKTENKSVITTI